MKLKQSHAAFLQWLKRYDPAMHYYFVEQLKMTAYVDKQEKQIGAVEAPTEPGLFDKVGSAISTGLDALKNAFTTIMPAYNQYRVDDALVKIQLERAKQGLPPLSTDIPAGAGSLTEKDRQMLQQEAAKNAGKSNFFGALTPAIPLMIGAGLLWAITDKKKGR